MKSILGAEQTITALCEDIFMSYEENHQHVLTVKHNARITPPTPMWCVGGAGWVEYQPLAKKIAVGGRVGC